jgi:hypothetical protein
LGRRPGGTRKENPTTATLRQLRVRRRRLRRQPPTARTTPSTPGRRRRSPASWSSRSPPHLSLGSACVGPSALSHRGAPAWAPCPLRDRATRVASARTMATWWSTCLRRSAGTRVPVASPRPLAVAAVVVESASARGMWSRTKCACAHGGAPSEPGRGPH